MKPIHLSPFLILVTIASLLLVACSPSPPQESQISQISVSRAPESTVPIPSQVATEPSIIHETIEESLLFDEKGIQIRAIALDFSNPHGPVLFYEIENQSEEAIDFFFYGVSVNGIMMRPRFSPWEGPEEENPYSKTLPGQTASLDMIFPQEDLDRALITKIQTIELSFYISDSKSKMPIIEAQNLLIQTNADPGYVQAYDDDGILVHGDQDMKIVVRVADAFRRPGRDIDPALPLLWVYIENKQEDGRAVLVEEMKVNGIPAFSGFQSYPRGNKRDYLYLYLDQQAFLDHDFQTIEKLSVRFQIRSDDYSRGPLYRTEPLVFIFGEDNPMPTE